MTHVSGDAVFETGPGLSVGSVVERSFALLGQHFAKFMVLTAVPLIPGLLLSFADTAMKAHQPGGKLSGNPSELLGLALAVMVLAFVSMIAIIISQTALAFAAYQAVCGIPISVAGAFRAGLGRFWPFVGMIILEMIGLGLGLVLLVIPGMILLTMWYMSVSVCVVERLGPVASLRRSAELSRGSRWQIFGLIAVFVIGFGIGGGILGGIAGATGSSAAIAVVKFVVQALGGAAGMILATVIYHDLRVSKEGSDTDRIAGVFS
jgi:hypothetical protein